MTNLHPGDQDRQDLYESRQKAAEDLEELFSKAWLGISRAEISVDKPLPTLRSWLLDLRVAFLKVDETLDELGQDYPEQQGWAIHLYEDLDQGLRSFSGKCLDFQAFRTYCDNWTEYLGTLLAEVTR